MSLFQGDVQSLLLIPDPEAAFEMCESYAPDCGDPFFKNEDSLTFYNTTFRQVSGFVFFLARKFCEDSTMDRQVFGRKKQESAKVLHEVSF